MFGFSYRRRAAQLQAQAQNYSDVVSACMIVAGV